jgi:hypothetical protein
MNAVRMRANVPSPIPQLPLLFIWYVRYGEWNQSPSSEDFERDTDLVVPSPAPVPES